MCGTLQPQDVFTHIKFGIPTANNIGDVPEVNVKVTTKQYGTLWHPYMYPHSKFGIPTSKQYKKYALDTIFLEQGQTHSNPEAVCVTLRPQGVSTH